MISCLICTGAFTFLNKHYLLVDRIYFEKEGVLSFIGNKINKLCDIVVNTIKVNSQGCFELLRLFLYTCWIF